MSAYGPNRDAPAYPLTFGPDERYTGPGSPDGLTKREAFAMAALQGLMAGSNVKTMPVPEQAAAIAVTLADCLLAELERRA